MKKKKKKKNLLVVNIEYALFLAASSIIKLLPTRLCFFIARSAGAMIYILDFKHRRRMIRNIMHAGIAEDTREAARIARKTFAHFGMVFVEVLKFRSIINPQNIREHIKFSGTEKNLRYTFGNEKTKSRQTIVVAAHFGNWEIAGMAYSIISGRPMLSIMRNLDNYKIGAHLEKMREEYQHSLQGKKGALKSLLMAVKKGDTVCLVSDQHASTGEGAETVFFGHPARSHASPASLHLRTGLPIVVGSLMRKDENFNFEFIVEDVIEYKPTDDREKDIQNVTQLYTSAIERMIRKCPEQWIWAHRRWLDLDRKKGNSTTKTQRHEDL